MATTKDLLALMKQFERNPVVGLVMHSAVLESIKRRVGVDMGNSPPTQFSAVDRLTGLAIYTDDTMPQETPTRRFIIRDISAWRPGASVDRDEVRIYSPFVEYGPEDIPWLLRVDLIREEMQPHFVEVRANERESVL